jgi:exopolysaccharide biosynthesis polyprenyl glycosylphosphotransferase
MAREQPRRDTITEVPPAHPANGGGEPTFERPGRRFLRPADAAAETLERWSTTTAQQEAEGEVSEAIGAHESRARDAIYRRSLALADVAAAALALLLAVVVLGGDSVTLALLAALPLVVVVGKVIGLYDRDEYLLHKTTLEEAPALFEVSAIYALLLWLGEGLFVEQGSQLLKLGRWQVVGVWVLLFVSMLAARALARNIAGRISVEERCLVLGGAEAAEALSRKLRSRRTLSATVVGRVPLEADDNNGSSDLPTLGGINDLPATIAEHRIHRVIIAPTSASTEQLLDAIRQVKALGVKASVLPRLFEVVGSSVHFDDVDGLMLLGVPRYGLTKSSVLLKRSMDSVGAGLGLVLLSPLLAVIAVAIKLSSRGPVLFHQQRIGRGGKEFAMLKFRTMVMGADEQKQNLLDLNEADGLFKIADDPRLTSVGKLLRRLSLDELPQLWNVLRGEMSLVGPRPLVKEDDQRVEGWQRRRLEITPGMTGIWQVLGSSRVPLHEMVKVDYLYGANWSLWLDMKILLRTVPHVVGRRGL